MRSRISIIALSIVTILAAVGCEEKTRYITTADAPATPVGVYSVTGDGYVDVFWQANNDGDNTEGYGVYRYNGTVGGNDEYVLIGEVSASPFRETYGYRDNNVQNGNTYYYAINAYNGYGESDLSDPDAFDTPRPQGSAAIDLTNLDLMRGGWDFSERRTRVWDSIDSDIFFEYDSDLDAFFIWSNHRRSVHTILWICGRHYRNQLGRAGEGEGWSTSAGWRYQGMHTSSEWELWTGRQLENYAAVRVTGIGNESERELRMGISDGSK
ncbi:MAG: hypothetical protein IPH59_00855 [bacterium]|nr:hypothetical protein [bacterium]